MKMMEMKSMGVKGRREEEKKGSDGRQGDGGVRQLLVCGEVRWGEASGGGKTQGGGKAQGGGKRSAGAGQLSDRRALRTSQFSAALF